MMGWVVVEISGGGSCLSLRSSSLLPKPLSRLVFSLSLSVFALSLQVSSSVLSRRTQAIEVADRTVRAPCLRPFKCVVSKSDTGKTDDVQHPSRVYGLLEEEEDKEEGRGGVKQRYYTEMKDDNGNSDHCADQLVF